MNMFVLATEADKPANNTALFARLIVAAFLTIVALAQLFKFEDFPAVLAGYSLPGGEAMATLIAALTVTVEVFAVPYLLMMRLSPLMRLVSYACGWLSGIIWLFLGLMYLSEKNFTENAGLLGDTVAVTSGWSLVLFAALLFSGLILAGPMSLGRLFSAR